VLAQQEPWLKEDQQQKLRLQKQLPELPAKPVKNLDAIIQFLKKIKKKTKQAYIPYTHRF
jgi:hypothetical protein